MGKHAQRHRKARMIRAQAATDSTILFSGEVKIEAAAGEGKPRRFDMLAYAGGELRVGGYPLPVVVDLAGMEPRAQKIPIYAGHHDGSDGSRLAGHADRYDKAGGQLRVGGAISAATKHATEILAAHDAGFAWQASIGAMPDRSQLLEIQAGRKVSVNGREFIGPIIVARRSVLRHIAILPEGADAETSLSIAASAAQDKEKCSMEFQAWVESMGLVLAELRDDQKAKLQAKYDAEIKAAAKKDGTPIQAAAQKVEAPKFDLSGCVLAYEKHATAVQAAAAKYVGKIDAAKLNEIQAKAGTAALELKAKALNEEWAPVRLEVELVKAQAAAEVELIRAERPKGPAIHASTHDVDAKTIEAAFCMAAGLHGVEKQYKPETLEAAAAYNRNQGASLQGLILAAAHANGYEGPHRIHSGNLGQVMRAAFIQAAASTHSLTTMLSTVGNKFLMDGFDSVEQVWREISDIRPVNDFKQITSYRMLDDMVFEEIGPDGQIKHGKASQESYTNQAKTYAKMFSLTRQDIINDDLGAFNAIRSRLGRGSGIKLNQIFWAAFLDDAAFFTSDRGNLITTALGESGIAAAVLALNSMTDGYGNPIDIGGQHILLTGATLNPTALKWYVSQEIRDTTASTKTPTTNIYQNKYRPVMSRYITDTTDWYLLPVNAGDMAVMETCFLDGVQSPTIESADADFSTLGVEFRGYWDFGVAKKEWRAAVKSAVTGGT